MKSDPTLGAIIEGPEPLRDAIHIAVIPQVATETMAPGEKVRLNGSLVGVVDPFLSDPVHPGQRYWLFLLPGSITGLRHAWTHPAFPEQTGHVITGDLRAEAERNLREAAADIGIRYDNLIEMLADAADGGEDCISLGNDEWGSSEGNRRMEDIIRNAEIVLGRKLKEVWFSCAC